MPSVTTHDHPHQAQPPVARRRCPSARCLPRGPGERAPVDTAGYSGPDEGDPLIPAELARDD
eukprot:7394658-Pyramimonas_sp.AAC.1